MSHFQLIILAIVLLSLISLSAFFSCAETAFMAVNRYRLKHQARLKRRYAMRLVQLLKRPDRLLGTILIGNTFANILASSLATLIALHFFGEKGAVLSAIVLTIVILIFAEIAPKTLAALYPDKVAKIVTFPIQLILALLYPLVWLANAVTNRLLRLFRVRVTLSATEPLTREELRSVVYETTGKISRQYQNMLLSILDLNKLTVDDVMVPAHEIRGINADESWEKIIRDLSHFHGDWIPVYRENINQVTGVLYAYDIIQLFFAKETVTKDHLLKKLQEPYFVPSGTSLNTLLTYFQQSTDKVAFIVDEYGEVNGLVTLNDILEEIVGDFTSTIAPDKRIQQIDENYLVDGAFTIREFNRRTGWELPLGGPKTVNGLIVEYLESLPRAGTAVLIAGYPIEIMQVKDKRVKLAKISPQLK